MITIEEALLSSDISTALTAGPYLIYSEVFEGARRPLVWLSVISEDFSLIGSNGYTLKFLTADHLAASEDNETNILGSGMGTDTKNFTSASLAVPNAIWCAVELSDFLMEDYPSLDWLRLNLRNMGAAVMEYLDVMAFDMFEAASGVQEASPSALTFGACTDALATMESENWVADSSTVPFLIVSPATASDLLQDTTFVSTARYTVYQVSDIVDGEIGTFAGMRVLKSLLLDDLNTAYIVFPQDNPNGPVAIMAWKARMAVKSQRTESHSLTYIVTRCRANCAVTQAKGICRISFSNTP